MGKNLEKYKYLVKNVGVLTIAQFGTKILSFLLVPLYTNVLTTKEYGINDLFSTTVTLLIPFLTLNIVDATIRYTMDQNNDKKDVFSVSIKYLLIGSIILLALVGINNALDIFDSVKQYWMFLWLYFISSALSAVLSGFARGADRVVDVAVSGVICSVVLIMANLILLIPFKMGLEGYFIANCLGPFAQIIYLLVRLKCWKYIKLNNDKTLEREMILYARPLIANSVAWWVNSASDRYIVTFICGVAVNGIYSVGYKIPSILAVFTNIFNQAWTLSAVHEFDSEDKGGFFSDMYNIYNFVITVFCSVLLIFTRIMAKFLYAKDFFEAWKFVPFLLIAFVFSSLSGYIGGIFSAVKDSKIFAKSTVIGAIVNIILNFILVICIGAIGAAISTIISYFVIWAIRVLNSKKYIKIKFYLLRDFLAYALLLIQTGLLFIVQKETYYLYLLEASLLFVILSLFKREIIFGLKRIKNFIKSINGL